MARPADRLAGDCAFCTCLSPRFDVVTLKTGVRHSEFCCACGRPGAGDVVSGGPLLADMPEPMQLLEPDADDPEYYWRAGNQPSPRARLREFPAYDAIREIEAIHVAKELSPARVVVQDPALVIAPCWAAAVPRQRYERTDRHTGIAPAPYDAVLSRKGNDKEILPELAPSFVGCLRAIFRSRGLLIPPSLCGYDGTVNEALQAVAERMVLSVMSTDALETRVQLEARVDANLRDCETRAPTQGKARSFADLRGATRYLRTLMRGVPPYRAAGEAIDTICGCVVYVAMHPAEEWRTPEPLVIGDDLWINAVRVSDLAQAVLDVDARRRATTPHPLPLRVIIPTKAAVMALFDDMRKETSYPFSVGPYGILPPIERPLFDHKTAPKIEAEIPYDWPRRHASDKSGAERLFMVEAIDDNTPAAGWTQAKIYDRFRAIYQERAKQVDFTVRSMSSENPPSLFIAKARSKTDGPSYRISWESPAPVEPTQASTAEVNASTFAYAPGERDAYPVGQAPGEVVRWSEILASPPRGSK